MRKKCFTLYETIDYLDNLEVSADDSESEGDCSVQLAKIFIEPLVNANNEKGKNGSEDENQPTGDAIILRGNKLLGSVFLQINTQQVE